MFKLPDLPYAYDALSPMIGETTMRTHHDKHHKKYIDTVNSLVGDGDGQMRTLEDIVREAVGAGQTKLANNAGQAWNHGLFWECMTSNAGQPSGGLMQAIEAFGGLDKLKADFVKQGNEHFGSGWAWLIAREGKLQVTATHDGKAELPGQETTPLLVCDLWEHAYYLDYKNDREAFLKAWFDKLANWRFAEAQYAAATGAGGGYRFPAPMKKAA